MFSSFCAKYCILHYFSTGPLEFFTEHTLLKEIHTVLLVEVVCLVHSFLTTSNISASSTWSAGQTGRRKSIRQFGENSFCCRQEKMSNPNKGNCSGGLEPAGV